MKFFAHGWLHQPFTAALFVAELFNLVDKNDINKQILKIVFVYIDVLFQKYKWFHGLFIVA
jgi:hypothetical protein